MFKAHVDDSGSSREDGGSRFPRYFVLAGYVLPVPLWEKFSDAWASELLTQPKVRAFKMYNADSGGGYFAGMSEEFRRCKVRDLAAVIRHFRPMAFACHLRWDEYEAKVAGRVHKKMDSPYSILFGQTLRAVYEWQMDAKAKNPKWEYNKVDFVFDEQAEVSLRLRHWYGPLRANMREPYRQMMGNPPDFRNDEDVVALQAADMLAWHVRRKLEFPEDDRPTFKQIAEHYCEVEIDADALSDFVERCKLVDPKLLED
jgi:hypothetical protein